MCLTKSEVELQNIHSFMYSYDSGTQWQADICDIHFKCAKDKYDEYNVDCHWLRDTLP